jgi:hypothetical protein
MSDEQPPSEGVARGGIPGWVWFVLVFGVGNLVLYLTTGICLIPIPRK